jgi:transposase
VDVIVERVAGLDIGKADLKACVRVPATSGRRRFQQETHTFSSMTRQLQALAAWLRDCQVSLVVMEATGDFWKPVFYLLEEQFTVWLVNARDVKKVPGRKTDVRDAEWLAQLAQHGSDLAVLRAPAGHQTASRLDSSTGQSRSGADPGGQPVGEGTRRRPVD